MTQVTLTVSGIGRWLCRNGWHMWGGKRSECGTIVRKCRYCTVVGQWRVLGWRPPSSIPCGGVRGCTGSGAPDGARCDACNPLSI